MMSFMSEIETRRGRIKLVPNIGGETTYEKKAKELIEYLTEDDLNDDLSYGDFDYSDVFELLDEVCYDNPSKTQYMVLNKKIYEVLEDVELDICGFCEMDENPDGSINFITSWYNGGGSLGEVLEMELKNKNL